MQNQHRIDTESATFDQISKPPIKNTISKGRHHQFRHFKALMRKNFISWKRTLFGSTMEFILPIVLMFVLVWARTQVIPYLAGNFDIYQIKKPFYSISQIDKNSGNWTMTNFEQTKNGIDLQPFMTHTNYTAVLQVAGQDVYEPLFDPLGPFFFFPPHCYARTNRYASPIIAYIDQDNQIQSDVVEQLQLFFQKQKQLYNQTQDLVNALSDPSSPDSLKVFFQLLDGGTTDEQIGLLASLGVPTQLVSLIQLLAIQNQTIYQTSQLSTTILLNAISVLQGQNSVIQQAILNSSQTTQQLLQNLTLINAVGLLGLNQTQTDTLFQLFSNQSLVQSSITNLTNLLQLNSTQQSTFQQLLDNMNQTITGNQLSAQQLSQLVVGNLTLYQFQNQSNSTVAEVAQQIGVPNTVAEQIQQIVNTNDQLSLFLEILKIGSNQTALEQLQNQYGIDQNQAYLLAQSVNASVASPQLVNQILSLQSNQSALLASILQQNYTQQTDQLQSQERVLIPELGQIFNLTADQQQSVSDLFSQNQSNSTPDNLTQNMSGQFFTIVGQNTTSNYATILPLSSVQNQFINIEQTVNYGPTFNNILNNDQYVQNANLTANNLVTLAQLLNLNPQVISSIQAMQQYVVQSQKNYNGYSFSSAFINENTTQIQRIFNQLNYKQFGNFTLKKFASNDELDAYISDSQYGNTPQTAGICFGFKVIENSQTDYELELMFNDLWPTNIRSLPNQQQDPADPTVANPQLNPYSYYVQNGYNFMNNLVANTLLKRKTNVGDAQIATMITPTLIPPVMVDAFTVVLNNILSLLFLLMYIPLIYRTVYRIVFEKMSKAKESMRIMGMTDLPYWTSWFAYYTLVNTVLVLGATATLLINVIMRQSALLLFLTLWIYGQSLFGLILVSQSFFQSPRAAAITCTIVYFGVSILDFLISVNTPRLTKVSWCFFFPQIAMLETINSFINFDTSGLGNTFSSWQMRFQNLSVFEGLILEICSGVVMFLLGLYLEGVMPKTYGQRKHPLFFLGFPWCQKQKDRDYQTINPIEIKNQNDELNQFETKYLRPECFEPAPHEVQIKELQKEILKVSDLRKVYENGFKAVDGMNIKMYADQIFVLLGHNGAGKTTTISMLTGLFNPTEGECQAFGVDLFRNMSEVRTFMGVCPQHDVLFELLTVEEHLSFFYDLKGANSDPQIKKEEINKLMVDVGIDDKRNALAYQLSGGNKRKLSVAIALCGGSKFVLLDEPTSGMDLQARRQLWDMLKKYKKDRIVVLTTHYMDEADILGDRIGIMSKGKMTCLGSSIFLKSKFGVGYNLTVVKKKKEINRYIMDFLHINLGTDCKLQSEVQSEMTIQIPQIYSNKFSEFFENFDNSLDALEIQSYGISISTLEEVFLKIGHLDDPISNDSDQNNPPNSTPRTIAGSTLSNAQSNPQQLIGTIQNYNQNDQKFVTIESDSRAQSPQLTNPPSSPSQDLGKSFSATALGVVSQTKSNEFSLKDNHKELDETFWNCLVAVLFKRVSNYRRNRKAIFNEVFVPALIVIAGFSLKYVAPAWRSPSRIQNLDRLPQPQQLLFNSVPVIKSDVNMSLIANSLPQSDSNQEGFQISYYQGNNDFYDFGEQVFELGQNKAAFPPFLYGSYQVYEANNLTQQYKVVSFVNLTSQDSSGLYPQFLYESILKVATGNPDFTYKLRSTPYPPTFLFTYRVQTIEAGVVIMVTAISYSVLITSIVSYLVVERIEGLKHLQVITGMQLKAYWIGNFIVDFIKMYLTILVTVTLLFGYKMNLATSYIAYLVFPFGILPFCYVTSFVFSADSAAQTFTMFFHFFTIGILSSVTMALRLTPAQQLNGDNMNYGLKLIPSYPLAASIFCDSTCASLAQARSTQVGGTGGPLSANVWDLTNNTLNILSSGFHLVLWSTVLILIEKGFFSWIRFRPNKQISEEAIQVDQDVQKEADRIAQKLDFEEEIQVSNFKKVYRTQSKKLCQSNQLVAVSNLSFGLQNGECFALLGVNGAGKSTTFKSLTCEVQPTSGSIKIAGYDVSKNFEQARKLIGYCPQQNLIFETMSVEEHIQYYARLKGIPLKFRKQIVEQAIEKLGLQEHRKKPAGTLSGGNKRKVCVAIALIGNPPIILLDEPSAGMDPEARRFMWSIVANIAQNKSSAVVLTTHSMEEAEALSTKMGIMVKGGIFKCFGPAQHIRNKFGTGYVIELKIRSAEDSELWDLVKQYFNQDGKLNLERTTCFDEKVIKEIQQKVKDQDQITKMREVHSLVNLYNSIEVLCQTFNEVELLEHYGNYMRLRVQRLDKSIGSVFGLVEQLKSSHDVCTYSVSQTTLEQIFQAFADIHFTENVTKFAHRSISAESQLLSDPENQPYLHSNSKLTIIA